MTQPTPRQPDAEVIEAFFDGRLSGPEGASVHEAIARDPALARRAELQGRIDDSLRRRFAPPSVRVPAPAPIPLRAPTPARRWAWAAAVAAALVLMVGGALWFASGPSETGPEALYHRLEATSFHPSWVCGTDAEFVERVHLRFGDEFLVKQDPGVGLIGWVYVRDVLSPQAAALMATVDGEHSVVLVDRVSHDHPLAAKPGSGLNVYRRQLGNLVLYEITPLPRARILDLAYTPPPGEVPPAEQPAR